MWLLCWWAVEAMMVSAMTDVAKLSSWYSSTLILPTQQQQLICYSTMMKLVVVVYSLTVMPLSLEIRQQQTICYTRKHTSACHSSLINCCWTCHASHAQSFCSFWIWLVEMIMGLLVVTFMPQ